MCLTELAGVTGYTGGVGRRYAATIPELALQGHEVTVILVADSPLVSDPPSLQNVTFVTSTAMLNLPWRLRAVPRALLFGRLLRAQDAELVYAPEWLGACAFAPKKARIITNLVASLSLIGDAAGSRALSRRSRIKSFLDSVQIWLEDRQIRRSEAVIACSNAILAWNSERFADALPVGVVVSNCIDVHRARDMASRADLPPSWPGGSDPVVLFAGRAQLVKGIDVAMSAFEQVCRELPNARFVIAGGEGDTSIDPTLDELSGSLDISMKSRTVFLGQIGEEELYACMRSATVVVCPSRWEAFGNIALEVRACKGVLVATSGSGFEESCRNEHDSLLVEPGAVAPLAKAISRVLKDDALREVLRTNGSRRVEDFTAASTARRLSGELASLWNMN